jgi:serine/threonine-protein kinase
MDGNASAAGDLVASENARTGGGRAVASWPTIDRIEDHEVSIETGRSLLHYLLVEKLGEGGMGVVWKAVDTTLDREVAIKFLPDAFAQDPERLARFEREAKLLASLNHPNIAAVYSVHEAEGLRFLAMEMVPGEDLAQRLTHGALPPEEALRIGLQVAEALEAAHDNGVIHRDLKPANVQMTPEGKVKVLDFGLAKALTAEPASRSIRPETSPTLTSVGTIAGVILGTAAYMSPEQAHGRRADRRADVWAFGCLLFEMVGGKPPFRGESVSDTLASVLKLEPDWELVKGAPRRIREILRRCLVKDPQRRLQAIGEARIAVEDCLSRSEPSASVEEMAELFSGAPQRRSAVPWIVIAGLGIALVASLWTGWRSQPQTPQPVRVKFSAGSGAPMLDGLGAAAVVSADGRRLAFVSEGPSAPRLWVRDLGELEPQELPGTLGASGPFFSPDGEEIGFFSGGLLKTVPVSGGATEVRTETGSPRGGTWCLDGSLVYSADVRSGLFRLRPGADEPEMLTEPDEEASERSHRWPQCLSDGESVVFMVQTEGKDYDEGTIEVVSLRTRERTVLHRGGAYPRVMAGEYLVFARKGTLFAAAFDRERVELVTRPEPVLEGVMSRTGNQAAGDGSAQFDVSHSGLLVYRAGSESAGQYPMIWVDREGVASPALDQLGTYTDPRISPDGTKVAVSVISGSYNDIWVLDLERGALTRLTFGGGSHYYPVWTPDSKYVTFSRDIDDSTGVYMKRADGSGADVTLIEPVTSTREGGQRIALASPCSWSPDGKTLAIHLMTEERGFDLSLVRIEDDGEPGRPEPFLGTPHDEVFPAISPDGRLLAYQSNESGGWQIFVRPYPDTGGRWQVSVDGGLYPRWSSDGREIFFRSGSATMAVAVKREADGLAFERPQVLFEGNFIDLTPFAAYDVDPSGRRFLMFPGVDSAAEDPGELIFVFDWLEELRAP